MEFAFAWFWSGCILCIPDCKVDHTHTLLLRVRPLTAGLLVVCFRVNNNSKYIFQKYVSSDATLGFAPPHMWTCFASVVLIKPKCCDLTALVLLIKSAAGTRKAFLFFFFFWSTTRSHGPSINPRVKLLRQRSGQQMFDSCFQQLSLHTDFILNTGHLVLGMASVHRAFFLLLLPAGCLPNPP